MANRKIDLFLSYAWGDQKYNQNKVCLLKQHLVNNFNYKIWIDMESVNVGLQLFEEIEKGMREASAVIIVMTKEYPLSLNCKKEISLADALGKPLIPLMFDNETEWPPRGLGMYLSGSVYLKFLPTEKKNWIDNNKSKKFEPFWDDTIMDQLRQRIKEYVKEPLPEEIQQQENQKNEDKNSFVISGENTKKTDTIKAATWEYTGEVKNGIAHGRGTKKWKSGVLHYGEWVEGQAQGAGIRIWNDGGGQFSGDWDKGMWVYGTYSWPDGGRYVGEFLNFKRHGDGIFKYHNGDRYVGGWKEDIKDGFGIYTYFNKTQYSGTYVNNKKQGTGTMKYENGDIYEGGWKENKKHGKGFYAYKTGNSYDGEWNMDTKQGFGIFVYHHGDKYEGNWDNSKRQGKGKYWFACGDIYDGDWVKDIKHGYGDYYYAGARKGDVYNGNWKDGKKHGHGRYTWADGRFYDGEWANNNKLGEIRPVEENDRWDGNAQVRMNSLTVSAPQSSLSAVKSARILQDSGGIKPPPYSESTRKKEDQTDSSGGGRLSVAGQNNSNNRNDAQGTSNQTNNEMLEMRNQIEMLQKQMANNQSKKDSGACAIM